MPCPGNLSVFMEATLKLREQRVFITTTNSQAVLGAAYDKSFPFPHAPGFEATGNNTLLKTAWQNDILV